MSFGFSVGDFIALGTLAFNVNKACRGSSESFKNISMEVASLHIVLKEVAELLPENDLSQSKDESLVVIKEGCEGVLKDLQALVTKYDGLPAKSRIAWDRARYGLEDISELRGRLTSNIVLLNLFMSTCRSVVESKLDILIQEFQDGRHEGTVISTVTVNSLGYNDQQTWRSIRKELEDIGISVAAFDSNKEFIMNWFQHALVNGSFEESSEMSQSEGAASETSSVRTIEVPAIHLIHCHSNETTTLEDITGTLGEPPSLIPTSIPTAQNESQNSRCGETFLIASSSEDMYISLKKQVLQRNERKLRIAPYKSRLLTWPFKYNEAFRDAVLNAKFDQATLLLSKGANIQSMVNGETSLCWAIRNSNLQTVKWLLNRGASPNFVCNGMNSLETALLRPQIPPNFAVAYTLLRYSTEIDYSRGIPSEIACVLHRANFDHTKDVVRSLNERGPDVDLIYILSFSTIIRRKGKVCFDMELDIPFHCRSGIEIIHVRLNSKKRQNLDTQRGSMFLIFTGWGHVDYQVSVLIRGGLCG